MTLHPTSQMSKLRPRVDGTHLWTLSWVGGADGTEMGGGGLDPVALSLYHLSGHQLPLCSPISAQLTFL